MKPIRIWYQSYVDYDNGKTYWDRLRKHLDEIAEPGTRSTSRASRRTIPMPMPSSNFVAPAK